MSVSLGPDSSLEAQVHTVDFEVRRGGLNVLVRGHQDECPVKVTQRGLGIQGSESRRSRLGESHLFQLGPVGAVQVVMGPCSGRVFLDLF